MQHPLHAAAVRWPYPPLGARPPAGEPTEAELDGADETAPDHPVAPHGDAAPCTGIRVVINGRVVVQRNFLQETVRSMVARAIAEDTSAASAA